MDAVVRKAYRLPPGAPTAYLREDLTRGGLGNTSLAVAYTATGIKNLTQAYADEGKEDNSPGPSSELNTLPSLTP
jgi:hypothetical protein